MRLVQTPTLDIALFDSGARTAPVVLLLHGWPDDATSWSEVATRLNEAGFRTVAPFLRGFGATRFRDASMPRTGNSGILAQDAIELMDALGIATFAAAGHDWGSNAVEAIAVGWPARLTRMAMLSTPPRLGGMPTSPFRQAQRQWYHWFQATARGAQAVRDDRRGFARLMWDNWSPQGWYDEATFDAVARSWDNDDWPDVTIHSYRARWDEAPPDPRSATLETKVKETKRLSLPTIYLHGAIDGVNPPETTAAIPHKFSGPFGMIQLDGVGHFPQREAAQEVAAALIAHLSSPD